MVAASSHRPTTANVEAESAALVNPLEFHVSLLEILSQLGMSSFLRCNVIEKGNWKLDRRGLL